MGPSVQPSYHSCGPLLSIIMKTACLLLVVFAAVVSAQDTIDIGTTADWLAACKAFLEPIASGFDEAALKKFAPAEVLADADVQAVLADVKSGNLDAACTKLGTADTKAQIDAWVAGK